MRNGRRPIFSLIKQSQRKYAPALGLRTLLERADSNNALRNLYLIFSARFEAQCVSVRKVKPKWHENLVLVCEKCGTKLEKPGSENPSRELKDWLKKQLLTKSLWGANRVVTSSCLDICPEGKVAVAFVSDHRERATFVDIVDPKTERDRVLHTVLERSNPISKERNEKN